VFFGGFFVGHIVLRYIHFSNPFLFISPSKGSVKLFHNESKRELNMKSEPP